MLRHGSALMLFLQSILLAILLYKVFGFFGLLLWVGTYVIGTAINFLTDGEKGIF